MKEQTKGEKRAEQACKVIDIVSVRRKKMPSYIKETLDYLDAHFSEKITVDALSEKLYVSKYHLMRAFKQETGKTIHEYLTEQRIAAALKMIRTGIPAQDVSEAVGYQEYSLFYKNFCKYVGTAPSEYQAQQMQAMPQISPMSLEHSNIVVLRKEFLQA